MGDKKNLYRVVTVTIPKQANLDESAVRAVLAKLGLKTEIQLKQFSEQNGYSDIVAYCLKYVHFGKNYTGIAKAARIAGQVTVTINVAVGIVNQIESFLGRVAREVKDRALDSQRQVGTGLTEAGNGVVKNNLEGLNNMDRGGGKALGGTFNGMTAPVGSDRFNKGFSDAGDGLVEFGKGLGKIFVQTPADFATMFGGRLISGWQTTIGLESIGRELDVKERQILLQVFDTSVELDAIRIKSGYAGLVSLSFDKDQAGNTTFFNNQRALTHGNTIYMKNKIPGTSDFYSTLVHETTHVWQNQNGGTDYMLEALHAQATAGYGYYEDVVKNKKTWVMLSPEQQAQLIQDGYGAGYFANRVWSGDPILTQYMNQVAPQLRAGQGAT